MNVENEVSVLEAIASHRAILLVGSGPSCEMGYPSWSVLAERAGAEARKRNVGLDDKVFRELVKNGRYPEALKAVERILGRKALCDFVLSLLNKGPDGSDTLYKIIARLPFACYLTTNFDNELKRHLDAEGRAYSVALNNKEDFYSFRDDMQDIIYKIHGDLGNPETVVLTSTDYTEFSSNPERAYFRQRLQMLFGMKRCVIVGYSLSDRDLSSVIESLKQTASELAPAYIFLPNATQFDVAEYAERFGIHVIPYKLQGTSHAALVKKLELYAAILEGSVRDSTRVNVDSRNAASLYLFRSLNKQANNVDLDNYTLMTIPDHEGPGITFVELFRISAIAQQNRLEDSLENLLSKGWIDLKDGKYTRTRLGDDKVLEAQSVFAQVRRFALAGFAGQLGLPSERHAELSDLLHGCLASIFESRGDAVVRSIFDRANYTGGAMVDIYKAILPYAQRIDPPELRGAFVRAVYNFITKPTHHQRTYLVALAQGYFLYHMMGRESLHQAVQDEVLAHSVWYVDSNLLIPLVATGCANYKFARELFLQIKALGIRLVVVPSVIEEVRRHLKWAEEHDPDDRSRFSLSMIAEGQQNLFVDGYIRSRGEGRVRSFSQYRKSIEVLLFNNAKILLESYGMRYENPRQMAMWDTEAFRQIMRSLEERRRKTMSFRRYFQVETDAELLYAMRLRIAKNQRDRVNDSVGFFSQSTLFSDEETEIRTWSGEAMFRFVQFISPVMKSEETLQECLQNELYNVGLHFIDSEKYSEFFKEDIDLAKVRFAEQKEQFRKFLQQPDQGDFDARFEALPDIQKPIFIRQMEAKIRMGQDKQIEALEEKLKEAHEVSSGVQAREEKARGRIMELEELLRRKEAELQTVKGENRNLKNGEAYKRIKKARRRAKRS